VYCSHTVYNEDLKASSFPTSGEFVTISPIMPWRGEVRNNIDMYIVEERSYGHVKFFAAKRLSSSFIRMCK